MVKLLINQKYKKTNMGIQKMMRHKVDIRLTSYITILIFLILINLASSAYYGKLQFKEGQDFTILQFTDLHYGENGEKDVSSTILQEKLINLTNPDLVVVTGDSVSGYAWNGRNRTFYSDCWKEWTKPMDKLKIPYAYTLGNHDDQGDFNRKQIVDLDTTHNYAMVQYNPLVKGATNYFLPIYPSKYRRSSTPAALVWLFDTNDENCEGTPESWGCLERDQIKWFEDETERIKKQFGYVPKGLAFFHIPLPEYKDMHNWSLTYGTRNEGINCPKKNTEFFKSMLSKQNIEATFCGHDHDNDFGGEFYKIELNYGRKTGYGGYGPSKFQRGARVIKLKELVDKATGRTIFKYFHYVIQEDGSLVDSNQRTWKGGSDFVAECVR